ncbi:MAG: hypothetical protein OEY14_01855 [Myxococcales bacterium]|nr:hypothetical protein [Myxococcales bacterium]
MPSRFVTRFAFQPALLPALLPVLLGLAHGCASAPLQLRPVPHATLRVAGAERELETYTDLDAIRDVLRVGERLYVATDRGVLVHPLDGSSRPARLTRAGGLPSDDVRALAPAEGDAVFVATAQGLVQITGAELSNPLVPPPPIGLVADLLRGQDGTLWACGERGLARLRGGAWEGFGEPALCTRLRAASEGAFYVGTARGLWRVEGETIREHVEGRGLPGAFVRDLLPLGEQRLFALVQDPSAAFLAYFDGTLWYSYAIEGLTEPAIGLASRGSSILLLTESHQIEITAGGGLGAERLTPLSRSEPNGARSYGARVTPAELLSREAPPGRLREPARLAPIPAGQPSVEAPPFQVASQRASVRSTYLVRQDAEALYLADRNRGLRAIGLDFERTYRSLDLLSEDDLQIASDANRGTWILTPEGALARLVGWSLLRVSVPETVHLQAIASGPDGAYALALIEGEENLIRIFRASRDGFSQVLDRRLSLPAPLAAVPLFGVAEGGDFWACVRVRGEEGARGRGCVQIAPAEEAITYHHRLAESGEVDGIGALRLPDEIASLDLGEPGMAWFSTVSGAVRLGNHQAVYFGEARGVRGEIVSDVAVGNGGRIWFAAAEGVAYYEGGSIQTHLPAEIQQARPMRLAVDREGRLWGVGPRGLVHWDGSGWHLLGEAEGLPGSALVDVEVDSADRLWILSRDRLLLAGAR